MRITTLKPDEIFVFGSNDAGVHGAGAAKDALDLFGAIWGRGQGIQGQSYAIPTKDRHLRTKDVIEIETSVETFLLYAENNPDKTFYVTAIGCGLAGLSPAQIAPMFVNAPANCVLPDEFKDIL